MPGEDVILADSAEEIAAGLLPVGDDCRRGGDRRGGSRPDRA